jgi:IS5 family transposase
MPQIIPFERPLRPALPLVRGNVDYRDFEALLVRVDQLLVQSGVEALFVDLSLQALLSEAAKKGQTPGTRELIRHHKHSIRALRTMVLQPLLNESYRGLSRRLAECPLFRWFCDMDELIAEVPAKSTLQRYATWIGEEPMRVVIDALTLAAAGGKDATQLHPMELAHAVELDLIWLDCTCVRANIHFPVDWLLLRDATRTLVKAVVLIRRHGLKHRIPEPESFLSRMNQLCIEMTHKRAPKEDSKRERKRVFRKMKKLVGIVEEHARRYRDLLQDHWSETDWSQTQANQVLGRMDSVLEKLPAAKAQAHQRIINERLVDNARKRLSLYEDDVHVIVRGKAGAAVEFGNGLLLAEQSDGLIVDFEWMREQPPVDSKLLPKSLKRIEILLGRFPVGVGGDRGFDSKANRDLLEEKDCLNAICPRNVQELKKRCKDEVFAAAQRRRAQTEGRIAIFKNKMLGGLLRAKGNARRAQAIGWAILSHNLWVLARLERQKAPKLAGAA